MNFTPLPAKLFKQAVLGTVEATIASNQRGSVRFQGTYWKAQFLDLPEKLEHSAQVLPGELVKVVGRVGLTLLVLRHDASVGSLAVR